MTWRLRRTFWTIRAEYVTTVLHDNQKVGMYPPPRSYSLLRGKAWRGY